MIKESPYSLWQHFLSGDTNFSAESLTNHLKDSFLHQLHTPCQPDFSEIDVLCEMALFKPDISVRQAAVICLYKKIIEPLCDDFTTSGVQTCNLVLLRMMDFIRKQQEGIIFDNFLNEQHHTNLDHLLQRYTSITHNPPIPSTLKQNIKKIIILSRVTVGADIAVTSVLVHRLASSFPQADIVVVGPSHLAEIFHGIANVNLAHYPYQRDGGISERLTGDADFHTLLKKEWADYHSDQVLFFDPDSRLSQLGLVPLFDEKFYYHFPSRNDSPYHNLRITSVVSNWLNHLLDEDKICYPQVAIRPSHSTDIKKFFGRFSSSTKKIVINLGVGNEPKKRLPDPFEEQLLSKLLQQKNTVIILDSGCHPDEGKRARSLMEKMKNSNIQTMALSGDNIARQEVSFQHGLVCINCGIGTLTALIDQCDVFFGYDSCCQHLATAMDTKTVICFAGAPNDRFFERWRPLNKTGQTTTIRISDNSDLSQEEIDGLAEKFCKLVHS